MQRGHWLQPDWRSGTHVERFERIRPYVEHRSVLDIGAGSGMSRPDWIHGLIADVASETVGIETDESLAQRGVAKGYNFVVGDAQTMDLGRTFQVVFAGELIEHLSCAGSFLDSVGRHLEPGGVIVLTTPNAFAISNFVYRLGGQVRVNDEHTCWYDEATLQHLLVRHGYEVLEMAYVGHRTPGRLRALAASTVRAVLPDRLASNTLVAVASRRIESAAPPGVA